MDQSKTTRIWSPHVHEDRPITDQVWGLCPYKPAPLCLLREHLPFPPKAASPWLSWNMEDVLLEQSRLAQNSTGQSKLEQISAKQSVPLRSRAEQSCLAGEEPGPRAASQPHSFHSLAVFYWMKFPSSLDHKLGIPVGTELAPMTMGWHIKHYVVLGVQHSDSVFVYIGNWSAW